MGERESRGEERKRKRGTGSEGEVREGVPGEREGRKREGKEGGRRGTERRGGRKERMG